jgi:hypothetical protein
MPRDEQIETLTAVSWDIRASAEAQVRALTALQRCLDDYGRTHDPHALSEMVRHLGEVEDRTAQVRQALPLATEALTTLIATHG